MLVKGRNVSIDILKIISCFGIVAIHTVDGSIGPVSKTIRLLTAICIPMFILINGYLMFSKSEKAEITYPYVLRKIGRILLVCLCWELLCVVKVFVLKRELHPFWRSFFLDFIQDGYFFQFWFLGTLIGLYLVLPLLSKLYRKNKKVFVSIFAVVTFLCVAVTAVSVIIRYPFQLDVIQTFRFWTWFFYFMLGGVLVFTRDRWLAVVSKHRIITSVALLLSLAGTVVWQWCIGAYFGRTTMSCFYQDFPIMIAVLALFVLISSVDIKNHKAQTVISKISMCTMGIYILHPDVLEIVKDVIPFLNQNNTLINLLFCVVVFVISFVISFVMIHIPVVKNLVSL